MIWIGTALAVVTLVIVIINARANRAIMKRVKKLEGHAEAVDEFAQVVVTHLIDTHLIKTKGGS